MKQCASCKYYVALQSGSPPAGWCEFIAMNNAPFWMEKNRAAIERGRADVLASDGAECSAHTKGE